MNSFRTPLAYSLLVHVLVVTAVLAASRAHFHAPGGLVDLSGVRLVAATNAANGTVALKSDHAAKVASDEDSWRTRKDEVQAPEVPDIPESSGVGTRTPDPPDSTAGGRAGDSMEGPASIHGAHMSAFQQMLSVQARNQERVMKALHFQRTVRDAVRVQLSLAAPEAMLRKLAGGSAVIALRYNGEGRLEQAQDNTATDESLANLVCQRVDWAALSTPRTYDLPNAGVMLHIKVLPPARVDVGVELL